MDEMKRRMAEAKAKQKANMDKVKALKALNKAAAPKSAPMPASPAPAAPAAGAKRAREDQGAELPASFDEALPKQPPGEVAAVELGAGAVGAHALVASELADASIATAPEASTCVGAVVGVGLDLGYGSSDEESEDEDMPATTTLAPEPALSAAPSGAAALPEGFFDDKSKDAVAHGKAAPKKLDIDEEFALFTEAVEEDIEALDKAEDDEIREMVETRDKDERLETADMLSKVEALRNARRSLMRKREAESSGKTVVQKPKFAQDDSESEDESEDEDDALDWRKRGL